MISSLGEREHFPAFLYIDVDDADDAYERAVDAGAEAVEAPTNQFYGDRRIARRQNRIGLLTMLSPVERRRRSASLVLVDF